MDRGVSIVTIRQTEHLVATTNRFARQPNPSIRCSLFSSRKTVLRGWLTELTDRYRDRVRRVPESRVQHGAKKTEVKIRLPGRAVRNTELRR
jgi:hypothetical protein